LDAAGLAEHSRFETSHLDQEKNMATDLLTFELLNIGVQVKLYLTFAGDATSGQIQSISGSVGSDPITGLDPSYDRPDNVLNTTYPYVTFPSTGGIAFDTQSGAKFLLYNAGISLSNNQIFSTGPDGSDNAFGLSLTQNVTPPNGGPPPTANNDFTHAVFGYQDIVPAAGVLANDVPNTSGDPLTVTAVNGDPNNVGQPVGGHYGSLQLFSDGHYTYTASGYSALPSSGVSEDFFQYTALEGGPGGGGSQSATLTVVVTTPGMTYLGGQANETIQPPLTPNGHNVVLDGAPGGDTLIAANVGATVLVGGNGDTLTGNKGTDTYVFMGQFGANTITNYNPAKDLIQLDSSEFVGGLAAVKLAAVQTASGTVITDPAHSADTITLTGVNLASLHFDANHFLLA
jgi:hypothetical protein